jgi:hypothetical protein
MAKGDDEERRRTLRAPRFTNEERAALERASLCTECGQRAPYCDECMVRVHGWASGTSKARGVWWAERALRKMVRAGRALEPWPSWDESAKVRGQAYRRVDCEDERLRERLARECYESAAQRWAQLLSDPAERHRILVSR